MNFSAEVYQPPFVSAAVTPTEGDEGPFLFLYPFILASKKIVFLINLFVRVIKRISFFFCWLFLSTFTVTFLLILISHFFLNFCLFLNIFFS